MEHATADKTRALLWFVLLLPFSLLICASWPIGWAPPTLPPPSVLALTPPGIAICVVGCALFLMFVVRGRKRRAVMAAVVLTLMALQIWQPFIGWGRIIVLSCGMAAFALLTEGLRQNIVELGEVRARDPRFWKKSGLIVVHWVPIALAAYGGSLIDAKSQKYVEQVVYDTTPVDQYCLSFTSHQVFPCSELGPDGARLQMRDFTLEEDIRAHLQRRILDVQSHIIHQYWVVWASSQQAFSDAAGIAMFEEELRARLAPRTLLGTPNVLPTEAELIARDAELIQLNARVRALEGRRHCTGFGDYPICIPNSIIHKAEIERTRAAVEARLSAIKQAAAIYKQPSAQDAALAQLAARDVADVQPSFDFSSVGRLDGGAAEERRALAIGVAIEGLNRYQQQITEVLLNRSKQLTKAQEPDFYKALDIDHRCTLAAKSRRVYKDDTFNERAEINEEPFQCSFLQTQVGPYRALELERSVDASLNAMFRRQERDLEQTTREAFVALFTAAGSGADAALRAAEAVPKTIDLGREPCRTLEPHTYFNCIINSLKRKTERAYRDQREDAGRKYNERVQMTKSETAAGSASRILQLHEASAELLEESRKATHTAVKGAADFLEVVSWVLRFLIAAALLKSALYVAGLVYFDVRSPSRIQVCNRPTAYGRIRVAHSNGSIDLSNDAGVPFVTKVALANQELNTVLCPKPFSAPLARMLRFKFFSFNKASTNRDSSNPVRFSCNGKYVIAWHLAPTEQVIFHYKYLFGFSDNVRLTSLVSLRMSTLLLGRMTFHMAEATSEGGMLLLTAGSLEGDLSVCESDVSEDVDMVPPERLVAWHSNTQFRVQNRLTPWSVINTSFGLVRLRVNGATTGRMLVERPRRAVVPFKGTFGYVARLIWPF